MALLSSKAQGLSARGVVSNDRRLIRALWTDAGGPRLHGCRAIRRLPALPGASASVRDANHLGCQPSPIQCGSRSPAGTCRGGATPPTPRRRSSEDRSADRDRGLDRPSPPSNPPSAAPLRRAPRGVPPHRGHCAADRQRRRHLCGRRCAPHAARAPRRRRRAPARLDDAPGRPLHEGAAPRARAGARGGRGPRTSTHACMRGRGSGRRSGPGPARASGENLQPCARAAAARPAAHQTESRPARACANHPGLGTPTWNPAARSHSAARLRPLTPPPTEPLPAPPHPTPQRFTRTCARSTPPSASAARTWTSRWRCPCSRGARSSRTA